MANKEVPIGVREYYKSLIAITTRNRNKALKDRDDLYSSTSSLHKDIIDCKSIYLTEYNFNVDEYDECVNNQYSTSQFYKAAKGAFINRSNNFKLVSDLFDLFTLAKQQKNIYDLDKTISLCDRILALSFTQYTELLRTFYTQVHKEMIIKGNGYCFDGKLGWICINRCKLVNPKPKLDYAATKKKEAELKEKGERVYNKDEANWCKINGIEYNAIDKRVFKTNEYCYEIPLIGSKVKNGHKIKFTVADYRHSSIRGKTNEDLLNECNNDVEQICNLKVDLKTKLTLCDKANNGLYINFIRNENQKSVVFRKTNR